MLLADAAVAAATAAAAAADDHFDQSAASRDLTINLKIWALQPFSKGIMCLRGADV